MQEESDQSQCPFLDDATFASVRKLTPEAFAALPQEQQEAFRKASGWHFGRRQRVSLDGMRVGGKTVEEVLAAQKQGKPPVGYIDGQPVHELPPDTFDGRI